MKSFPASSGNGIMQINYEHYLGISATPLHFDQSLSYTKQ